MTDQVGNHGLFCLDDDDFAAYALAMQCNALAVDAALSAQSTALGQYLGRPWWQRVSTASIVVDDSGGSGVVGPNGVTGAVISLGVPVVTANIIDDALHYPPGIFFIGATIQWTLVTPTANSYRELQVFGVQRTAAGTSIETNFVDLVSMRDYQGDGGNSGALNVWGFLDTRNGDISRVEAFFSHGNTGGDLTILAGGWRIWSMYLGSGLTI